LDAAIVSFFFLPTYSFCLRKKLSPKTAFVRNVGKENRQCQAKRKKEVHQTTALQLYLKKPICLNKVVSNFYLTGLPKFLKGIQKLSNEFI